jgi:hypothetical protein
MMRGEELRVSQIPNEKNEPSHKRDSPVDAFHMPALATNMNNI